MNEKILFVDDDQNILAALRRQLHSQFAINTVSGPEFALEQIRKGERYAVVVSDLRMPGMDGIQFLSAVHDISPDSVRVMLTGNADVDTAISSVNEGNIFRFLTKPIHPDTLVKALKASLAQYRLVISERELLQNTLNGSIKVLIDILSLTSPVTFSRTSRMTRIVRQISTQMMIPNTWQYELAALLSQIGCVVLPTDILDKVYAGEPLEPEEQKMFESHPKTGRDLLTNIPRLSSIAQMIALQLDPSAAVDKSTGDQPDAVKLGAMMLKVALDFDSMLMHNIPRAKALEELRSRPAIYDSMMVAALEFEETGRSGMEIQRLMIDNVRANMIAGQDVSTTSGTLLVAKGQEISRPVLERLQLWHRRKEVIEPIVVLVNTQSEPQGSD
jgi:response regulator RpfG family c-di-GMP phosphodiesterase